MSYYSLGYIFLYVLSLLIPVGVAKAAAVDELESCINYNLPPEPTTFEHFREDRPARLLIHRTWHSRKLSTVDLTIVTSLTFSRLNNLEKQCLNWNGPLSATVYLNLSSYGEGMELNEAQRDLLYRKSNVLQGLYEKVRDFIHNKGTFDFNYLRYEDSFLFIKKMEALEDACKPQWILAYEMIQDPLMHIVIPLNSMRNYALLNTKTRLLAMIDVDLIPSLSLYDDLRSPDRIQDIKTDCSNNKAYVLPAFEVDPRISEDAAFDIVDEAVKSKLGLRVKASCLNPDNRIKPVVTHYSFYSSMACGNGLHLEAPPTLKSFQYSSLMTRLLFNTMTMALPNVAVSLMNAVNKTDLRYLWMFGNIIQFAGKRFPLGHNATDYEKWFRTQHTYCTRKVGKAYEPWFIIDRLKNPFYDARFRGYSYNKIAHVETLRNKGYQFLVHPTAFVVHRPHERSQSEAIYRAKKFGNERLHDLKKKTRDLKHYVARSFALGQYKLVVDAGVNVCHRKISWWRDYKLL